MKLIFKSTLDSVVMDVGGEKADGCVYIVYQENSKYKLVIV